MAFRIEITALAEADLNEYADWIAQDSPVRAGQWYARILDEIESLQEMPLRYPLAYEAEALNEPIRHLILGQHRVLYVVAESSSVVYVLRVWPAARGVADAHDVFSG